MPLEFHWAAPLNGDGVYLNLPSPERPADFAYLRQIFAAAEKFGFKSVLLGVGFTHHTLEGWTVASALLPQFERIEAMVAIRPGLFDAPLFAKMAVTLDHISAGRVRLNIVTGGRPREEAMYGDFTDHAARYRRTREFLEICQKLWSSLNPFDYAGEFYRLEQCVLELLPATPGGPSLYFGGASPDALPVCAAHADVYMMWGEPLPLIVTRVNQMRLLAASLPRPRPLKFGLRINIFARPTEEEATQAAFHTISKLPPAALKQARSQSPTLAGDAISLMEQDNLLLSPEVARESVGQARQWALRNQADEQWWVAPGMWAGLSLVRRGAGMALVGSYQQVADYLLDFVKAGVEVFILSGYPHLEEAENVGLNVLPLLREKQLRTKGKS